ncbi:MAG: tyrosine-type recombinase/integrase [Bacillota bacterium]
MAGQLIQRGERTWLVRVYLGRDAEGKRKYHNKTIHGTKKDAQKYLNKVLLERDTTGFTEPSKELLSFYLERWLNTVAKPRVSARTFQSYKEIASAYLKEIGDTPISKLKPADIQAHYNSLLDRGLSPRTVRYAHAVLRSALSQGVKWNLLYRNPCDLVDLPKQQKRDITVLAPKQAQAFMEAVVYSPWKAFFSLLLASGMRPGEALGLKWTDIDFERGRVHVQRALSRTKDGWRLDEPKTARSRRVIPLPLPVLQDLRDHKRQQAAARLKNPNYQDHGLVFANEDGTPADPWNIVKRHFKPLLKNAGLPDIRLYDLRHTCATLLLVAGENPKIVSERLGHASVTMTLDTYSHVLPDMQENATAKLEVMLFNGRNTP